MATDSRHAALAACALTLLLAIAYGNSFLAVPQFDDYHVIIDNPAVASLSAWWQSLPAMRPLLKFSYALNASSDGLAGYHAINLLMHALNALLVFLLLRRLLGTGHAAVAGFAALMFAVHPVNSEAVTMLSGRSVSLMSAFYLGSLLAFLGGRNGVSLALFAGALLCRESAISLPAVLVLIQLWQPETREARSTTRWHWSLLGVAIGAALLLPRYRMLLEVAFTTRPILDNLITQSGAVLYLFLQLLRPWAMNADPLLPVFSGWNACWVLNCAISAIAIGWSLVNRSRQRWLAFAILWYFLLLAPGNSLIPRLDVANERQLYLAAVPLYAGLGLLVDALARRWQPLPQAIAVLLLVALSGLTALRNTVYFSESSFWQDVVRKSPANARGWNNLGYALQHAEPVDPAGALAAYDRAIMLSRDFKPRFNRRLLCASVKLPGCESTAAQP